MHLVLQFYAEWFEIYRCLDHGLDMYIFFAHNPQIFLSLFTQNEHSNFCSKNEKILGMVIFAAKINRYLV